MALAAQMNDIDQHFQKTGPKPILDIVNHMRANIPNDFAQNQTKPIGVGDKLPPFNLPNAVGTSVSSDDLLKRGPLLIIFYRGAWCPFCNLTVAAYQKHISAIHSKGVEVVAISPELPNTSMTMTEKNKLDFAVLTDRDLSYSHQLGIVWEHPKEMQDVFKQMGVDFVERTGRSSLEVPIPATFLVGQDGIIMNAYTDPDYSKRLEPTTAVQWIDEMKSERLTKLKAA